MQRSLFAHSIECHPPTTDNTKKLYRKSDPITSAETAKEVKHFKEKHKQAILRALEDGNAGQTLLSQRTGLTTTQINRRLKELKESGKVEPTGNKVKSLSNHPETEYKKV